MKRFRKTTEDVSLWTAINVTVLEKVIDFTAFVVVFWDFAMFVAKQRGELQYYLSPKATIAIVTCYVLSRAISNNYKRLAK